MEMNYLSRLVNGALGMRDEGLGNVEDKEDEKKSK